MPVSVKKVPPGWVELSKGDVDYFTRLGSPILMCGITFFVPRWARRLIGEWPLSKIETVHVNPAAPYLLQRVIRIVAHDRFEEPEEGVEAVLATIRLGGFAGVRALLWEEEDQ